MKTSNSIICLLSCILLSSSLALNQPEGHVRRSKEERHRKLFLFNEQRCNNRAATCRASVGVEQVPVKQWSSLLGQMTGDDTGLLDTVRVIIGTADGMDIESLLDGLQDNLRNTGIIKIISMARGFIGTAQSVITVVQDGDYGSAIDVIMELIGGTNEMFGSTSVSDDLNAILDAILQVINAIIGLIVNGIEGVFQVLEFIIVGLADFFLGLFRLIIGIITGDPRKPMASCNADYLQCQTDKLLLNAVPNLINLVFLTAGESASS
jgi:hypothetical protein